MLKFYSEVYNTIVLASRSPTKHFNGSKSTKSLFLSPFEFPFKSPGNRKGWKSLLGFPRATRIPGQKQYTHA